MSSIPKQGEILPGDAPVPSAVVLVGRWGSLRPIDAERDASCLYPLSHDEHTNATWVDMKVGPFDSEQAFADHVAEMVADKKRAFFAVTGLDDKPLGWLCLMEARPAHHVVELGYVLYTPPLQRTRPATEALYLILRHVFDDLGYRRLEWTCTSTNQRSRKAADRLGFVYEGTQRQGLFLKGKPCDICVYSMLSSEWPAHRSAFEAWLDPGNFANGQQLRSLAEIRAAWESFEDGVFLPGRRCVSSAGDFPMIAVISELWPYPDRQSDYVTLAAELRPLLESIDGFISAERFESCQEPGKFLSFSLWRDEIALAHWRNLGKHRLIMAKGRDGILRDYHIRASKILWDYSLKGRSEAPADSRALFG